MADIGSVSVYFAFFLALYTIFSSIYGIRSSNRDFLKSSNNSVHAISALLIIATICLLHELYYLNFNLKYVALNTSTDLPIIYRITALWAGQAGSLLLWCLILSIYTSLVTFYSLSQKRLLKPYVSDGKYIFHIFNYLC